MIKIFIESDKFSHIAGVTLHATNRLARKSLLHVSMFKLFIESDYIENNLIYFNLNKGDVLRFNQSIKALSDHRINRCFDTYVIQLYI